MRKAQGLSMNTIIIAALALLVLTVLAMVFMSRSSIFVSESGKCTTNGGVCTSAEDGCPDGMVRAPQDGTMSCEDSGEGDICCISGERIETGVE